MRFVCDIPSCVYSLLLVSYQYRIRKANVLVVFASVSQSKCFISSFPVEFFSFALLFANLYREGLINIVLEAFKEEEDQEQEQEENKEQEQMQE